MAQAGQRRNATGLRAVYADPIAASFQQQRVPPDAVMAAETFPAADDPKTTREMQGHAGLVFGEDARLQRPHVRPF